ncbi:hypothetical protein PFISCL1PPCAC_28640, partial [Pristionchus fissidentatus]
NLQQLLQLHLVDSNAKNVEPDFHTRTADDRYSCELCNQEFTLPNLYKMHMRNIHEVEIAKSTTLPKIVREAPLVSNENEEVPAESGPDASQIAAKTATTQHVA